MNIIILIRDSVKLMIETSHHWIFRQSFLRYHKYMRTKANINARLRKRA